MPLCALALAAMLAPQEMPVHVSTPRVRDKDDVIVIDGEYGPPQPEALSEIVFGVTDAHRNVLTRGTLAMLVPGRYLALRDGTAIALLVLFPGAFHDFEELVGREVDVAGVVRPLPETDDKPCRGSGPGTCDDPHLPLRPGSQQDADLPRVTISAYKISDRGTGMNRGRSVKRALADTGLDAAAADGKPVRAIGQFRGSNLCRDLPDATRRLPTDWVLLTPEGPVWVTGRRPEGKGFRLDSAYRADVSRWLEVAGRVETAGAARYVKASSVAMIARPQGSEDTSCSP
jgi:hypothetical protein